LGFGSLASLPSLLSFFALSFSFPFQFFLFAVRYATDDGMSETDMRGSDGSCRDAPSRKGRREKQTTLMMPEGGGLSPVLSGIQGAFGLRCVIRKMTI
jgi:hypothetical protein